MVQTSALEFQRKFGEFQHQAQREPAQITRHGRQEFVLMSAEHYTLLTQATYGGPVTDHPYTAHGSHFACVEPNLHQARMARDFPVPRKLVAARTSFEYALMVSGLSQLSCHNQTDRLSISGTAAPECDKAGFLMKRDRQSDEAVFPGPRSRPE